MGPAHNILAWASYTDADHHTDPIVSYYSVSIVFAGVSFLPFLVFAHVPHSSSIPASRGTTGMAAALSAKEGRPVKIAEIAAEFGA